MHYSLQNNKGWSRCKFKYRRVWSWLWCCWWQGCRQYGGLANFASILVRGLERQEPLAALTEHQSRPVRQKDADASRAPIPILNEYYSCSASGCTLAFCGSRQSCSTSLEASVKLWADHRKLKSDWNEGWSIMWNELVLFENYECGIILRSEINHILWSVSMP